MERVVVGALGPVKLKNYHDCCKAKDAALHTMNNIRPNTGARQTASMKYFLKESNCLQYDVIFRSRFKRKIFSPDKEDSSRSYHHCHLHIETSKFNENIHTNSQKDAGTYLTGLIEHPVQFSSSSMYDVC